MGNLCCEEREVSAKGLFSPEPLSLNNGTASSPSNSPKRTLKNKLSIVLLGDCGTGKTSIVHRCIRRPCWQMPLTPHSLHCLCYHPCSWVPTQLHTLCGASRCHSLSTPCSLCRPCTPGRDRAAPCGVVMRCCRLLETDVASHPPTATVEYEQTRVVADQRSWVVQLW